MKTRIMSTSPKGKMFSFPFVPFFYFIFMEELTGKPSVCLKEMEEDGLLSTADRFLHQKSLKRIDD